MEKNQRKKAILKLINKLKTKHKIIPLFYVESGSRLWGFENKDSDFDVRGFHLLNKKDYFGIRPAKDMVEIKNAKIDLVSFSIDKAFGLLLNSNPSVCEWIRSDLIYYNDFASLKDLENFRKVILKCINLKALFHHYLSMAKENFYKYVQRNRQFTSKRVVFIFRGLYSALFIYDFKQMPPLALNELIEKSKIAEEAKTFVKEIVKKKREKSENALVEEPEKIKNFISKVLASLEKISIEPTGNKNKLFEILNSKAIELKNKFYSSNC